MGIFMAVAEESEQEPKLIILEHNAGRDDLPTVVLVGKGVTFDSGGISIKPGEDMWKMKGDMAGAAAVIAALGVAARLNLPLHVVGSGPVRREPARRPRAEARRRLHRHDRQDDGGHQHRRRGAHAAGRRAGLCRALQPGRRGRHRHPDGRAGHGARARRRPRLQQQRRSRRQRCWPRPMLRATGCGACRCTTSMLEAIKSQVADVKNTGGRTAASAPAPSSSSTSPRAIRGRTSTWPRWALAEDDKPAQPKGATGYGVRLFTAFLEAWGKQKQTYLPSNRGPQESLAPGASIFESIGQTRALARRFWRGPVDLAALSHFPGTEKA